MLRQTITRSAPVTRAFSTARPVFADSKTDSFKQREAADENVYVKQHEAEQLKKLKEKLEEQKKVVDKLEKDLKDLKK